MNLENLTPLNPLSPGTAVLVIPESGVETKGEQTSAPYLRNFGGINAIFFFFFNTASKCV